MPSDSQSASTDAGQAQRALGVAVARGGHRDALHLEARLDDVAQRKRGPQALAVALLGLRRVAADERAVGEEVVREVLGARIAARPLEQLARHRLRALDLAQRDEHLADADERARLAGRVAELAAELEALARTPRARPGRRRRRRRGASRARRAPRRARPGRRARARARSPRRAALARSRRRRAGRRARRTR